MRGLGYIGSWEFEVLVLQYLQGSQYFLLFYTSLHYIWEANVLFTPVLYTYLILAAKSFFEDCMLNQSIKSDSVN